MTTVMFSFSVTPTQSNIEIVAQILSLLDKLDSPTRIHFPVSTSETIDTGVLVTKEKAAKPKKARNTLTDADFE